MYIYKCKGEVIEEDTREIVKAPSVETGKTGVLSTGLSRWIWQGGKTCTHVVVPTLPQPLCIYTETCTPRTCLYDTSVTRIVMHQLQCKCTHILYTPTSVITFKM